MNDVAFRKLCREVKRQHMALGGELTPEVLALWPQCPMLFCPYRACIRLDSRLCFPHMVYYHGGIEDFLRDPLIPYSTPSYANVN